MNQASNRSGLSSAPSPASAASAPSPGSPAPAASPAAGPLAADELAAIHAWWRAANYLSVGQIYLLDNPLLRAPLTLAHVKPRLLGHWGTSPGLNFIYAHLNRVIRAHDLNVLNVTGPGHGGPALVAAAWLDGTYSECYPEVSRDAAGMRRLFKQFSFPGGISSHVGAETPGSISEGGELGYSLLHAYGAAFDNPDLIVACVVGDGEAETGPLATSWHSNKFLDPVRDGAVLPILHLNGYKIASPTFLARIPHEELDAFLRGCGYAPHYVEGGVDADPLAMHQRMATVLDAVVADIAAIRKRARTDGVTERPQWPMIVLRTPKGWTGPRTVDGLPTEGSWRSHQVPLSGLANNPAHLAILEDWLKSYRPEELFDVDGRPLPAITALTPAGPRRMSANPHANGGQLLRDLVLPALGDHALKVTARGALEAESTRVVGTLLRDALRLNDATRNFRVFGPDETNSNRLNAVFEATDRVFQGEIIASDNDLARDGRVMEVLSEHMCQGWLEGYLLTGRHGFFSCYEAFIHIVDSMFNQHAKWLKVAREVPWRKPVASLTYLLTSHVWRQDNNGFSHQDPGFIDHVVNKKADVVRVYLPPDANTLLCVADHCLRTRDYVNVIVAGKQPAPQWLTLDEAVAHCRAGAGVWDWAGNAANGTSPDVVLACAGDVPTMETLAAAQLLRRFLPRLAVRVVNVVDLMCLEPAGVHPHGLTDAAFDALFTGDRPVVFAFHGYPSLIHRLAYRRANHGNFHVHGYHEEGTTTTPFDMTVINRLDRFHLAMAAVKHAVATGCAIDPGPVCAHAEAMLARHHDYIREHGEDLPEIRDWRWSA